MPPNILRKRMPEHLARPWASFREQAERVEQARQALLGCLPVGRVDPAPVPVGLDLLRDELGAVRAVLGTWRVDEVAEHWRRCAVAIEESLAQVPATREVAESTGELEELLEAVTDVVEPLDVWGDAERAWLRLRVRG
jgi:hypothetical protein